MLEPQRHRGPDGSGTFVDANIGLGHVRLSIVDLSDAGAQPFLAPDGLGVLVFNGEIYNHGAMRTELAALGATFAGSSDTETLCLYLSEFGIERTLAVAEGMFAFCFFDRRTRHAYLCRDRFGIKPLHWLRGAQGIAFSSEIKGLRAHQALGLDPYRVMTSILSLAELFPRHTLFGNVEQVPPGHLLTVREDGSVTETRYFDPLDMLDAAMYREFERMRFDEVVDVFSQRMGDSVSSMLMGDARMGVFVSGGVDSSLIGHLAHHRDPTVNLFSSCVVGRHSEFEYAQLLADGLGAEMLASEHRPADTLKHLAQATYHYEVPVLRHLNSVAMKRVASLAHETGVKAVLTGEGADELFWGYPVFFDDSLKRVLDAPRALVNKIYSMVPGLSTFVDAAPLQRYAKFMMDIAKDFDDESIRLTAISAYRDLGDQYPERQAETITQLGSTLLSLLQRNDRMGMSASIESRFPFLDEQLVRFAVNLPGKHKIRFTPRILDKRHPFLVDKAVVRASAARYLSPRIAYKRKLGFHVCGHGDMKVSAELFKGGFLQDQLRLTPRGIDTMLASSSQTLVAKLGAVEVFGRIFGLKQDVGATQDLIDASLSFPDC